MKREDILILLAGILFLQGYLLENVFPAILATALVFYLVYLRREFSPDVTGEREIQESMVEGEKTRVRLRIKNNSGKDVIVTISERLPPGFRVENIADVFLKRGEEREIDYHIIPVRGYMRLKALC